MSLNLVSEQLLAANGLKHQDLFAILGQLAERRLDYGDLYFQSSYHESWVLEDRIIKMVLTTSIRALVCVQSAVKKPDLLTLTKSACWRWNRVRKRRAPSSVIVVMVKYRRWAR